MTKQKSENRSIHKTVPVQTQNIHHK